MIRNRPRLRALLHRLGWRFPRAASVARVVAQAPGALRMAADANASRTYFPAHPRKGRLRIAAENLLWLVRHGEPCTHYFAYGLDRRDAPLSTVLPYPTFRRLRDGRNREVSRSGGFDYLCLLRDKYIFAQLAHSLDVPTPRNLAILGPELVEWLPSGGTVPLAALLERDLDGFCKPVAGIEGKGIFSLRIAGGMAHVAGTAVTLEDLRSRLSGRYILQEPVAQHADLDRLHPPSVNTLRVITIRSGGRARLFLTFLRIGAGGSTVDNFSAGGVMVSVNPATGRLVGRGLKGGMRFRWLDAHPDTGVPFDGYPIPFAREAFDLARSFHDRIVHIHSIGWDVAITPDGPTLIEGNDNWGARNLMVLEPDFRRRFLAAMGE